MKKFLFLRGVKTGQKQQMFGVNILTINRLQNIFSLKALLEVSVDSPHIIQAVN